jgi:hypothetical protein
MSSSTSRGDPAMGSSETLEAIRSLQQSLLLTDSRLQKVEEVSRYVTDTQQKIDAKMDVICNLLQNWTMSSEMGSAERQLRVPPPSTPTQLHPALTEEDLAVLKKQEAKGKFHS